MSPTIEVIITPQGETTITTRGFVGGECRAASQHLERALGIPTKEQPTAEYYANQATQTQQQQRLGG
jgi:hypothetical protein